MKKITRRDFVSMATMITAGTSCAMPDVPAAKGDTTEAGPFLVHPIGTVIKRDGKTTIVLKQKYKPGLLRFENLSHVTVVYWFHKNDTDEKRSILQVHPQGNTKNPLTGVFATHAPVRPNLIAISRCKILSVKDNIIEIDGIDAFDGTPVIDMKS